MHNVMATLHCHFLEDQTVVCDCRKCVIALASRSGDWLRHKSGRHMYNETSEQFLNCDCWLVFSQVLRMDLPSHSGLYENRNMLPCYILYV